MYTNADCTIYRYEKNGKSESYTRLPVKGIYWEDVRHSTFTRTGQQNACSTLLILPMESLKEPLRFTIGKDFVIKGLIEDEVDGADQKGFSESLVKLKNKYDCRMVVSVDERMYGGTFFWHYELACK